MLCMCILTGIQPEYFIKLEDDIMEDTKGDDAGERLDDEMLEEEGMDNGKP